MYDISLLFAVIPIYAMVLAGWAARRQGWLKPEGDSSLMRFAIDVTLPCFIFSSMIGNKKLESVAFALSTISIGMFTLSLGLVFAWLASKLLRLKVGQGQRTFVVTTATHNFGFFVIALVAMLYSNAVGRDAELLGLVFTHNVGCDIIFWTIGYMLITSTSKISMKTFLRGPILSVLAGLLFIWTGLSKCIPDCVMVSLKMLGGAAIPMNLVLFGAMIYDMFGLKDFNIKVVVSAVALRMFVLPAIFVALAVLLPVDILLKKLLVFQAVAPCGVTAAVLAKHFGGYPQIAVQITLATMVVAIFTLPFWLAFGFSLIGA